MGNLGPARERLEWPRLIRPLHRSTPPRPGLSAVRADVEDLGPEHGQRLGRRVAPLVAGRVATAAQRGLRPQRPRAAAWDRAWARDHDGVRHDRQPRDPEAPLEPVDEGAVGQRRQVPQEARIELADRMEQRPGRLRVAQLVRREQDRPTKAPESPRRDPAGSDRERPRSGERAELGDDLRRGSVVERVARSAHDPSSAWR